MAPAEDDQITEDILSDDPEKQVRYESWAVLGRYSLAAKFRMHGAVAAFAAASIWVGIPLGGEQLQALLGGDALAASVRASLVLAMGLQFLTIATGGLGLVGALRWRTAPEERDFERLLGLEETAAVLGLGTGGLGTAIGVALFAVLAAGDVGAASGWQHRLATPIPLPATYGVLLWWAVVLAVACLVGSVVVGDQ